MGGFIGRSNAEESYDWNWAVAKRGWWIVAVYETSHTSSKIKMRRDRRHPQSPCASQGKPTTHWPGFCVRGQGKFSPRLWMPGSRWKSGWKNRPH